MGVPVISDFNDFHFLAKGKIKARHEDIQVFSFAEVGNDSHDATPLMKTVFYQIGLFRKIAFEVEYFGKLQEVKRDNVIVLFKPGQIFSFKNDPDAKGYAIMFKEHFLNNRLGYLNHLADFPFLDPSHNSVYFPDDASFNTLMEIAERMHIEYQEPLNHGTIRILQLYVHILLLKMKQLPLEKDQVLIHNGPLKTSVDFKNLVYRHLHNTKKVIDYARMLFITEKTLTNHFREITGITPKEFIINQIIEESKAMLLKQASIEEVANHFNFNDPANFSNFFRKRTGLTPAEFKKIKR